MLFNSFEFILGILPVVAVGFFAIGRANRTAAAFLTALTPVLNSSLSGGIAE